MGDGRRLLLDLLRWPITGGAARLITLFAFFGILLYYVPEREQAISVSASTERLVVEVTSNQLFWDLPEILICYPPKAATVPSGGLLANAPEQEEASDVDAGTTDEESIQPNSDVPRCDNAPAPEASTEAAEQDASEETKTLRAATVAWPEGYRLEFRAFDDDYVEVGVTFPPTVPSEDGQGTEQTPQVAIDFEDGGFAKRALVLSGSILRIPYFMEGERTVLALRGYVIVGGPSTTANTHLLRAGSYESRQTLRPGQSPPVVANATFLPGDRVSFERHAPPFWARIAGVTSAREDSEAPVSRAFLTDLDLRNRAFDVVVTTEPFFGAVVFTRVGGQPTDIIPPWTARLAADAVPVAVATVLGLVATILAILRTYLPDKGKQARAQESGRTKREALDAPDVDESLGPE
ncbi:MAG: hypothetical protein AAFQ54_01985 [Pseudomonadota bacterium]